MYYPSGLFRQKARAALKGHWQTALLIALIVNLPMLLMQGLSSFTGNDVFDRLQTLIISASRDGRFTNQLLQDEIQAILKSTTFWILRGGDLLAWLITPCLSLGMNKWLMDRLRGQDGPVGTVFCRVRIFWKSVGLHLLVVLKILLWMLPGIALTAASMIPVFRAASSREQLAMASTLNGLTPLALAAILVPGVMAALRYALAEFIQADQPETRVVECVRRSKKMTAGMRKTLFSMMLVFLLWYLAQMFITSMLAGASVILSLVVQMLAVLALNVYMAGSLSAFYLQLSSGEPAAPENEELN
jgi:uncharacterized membrane protein